MRVIAIILMFAALSCKNGTYIPINVENGLDTIYSDSSGIYIMEIRTDD